MRRRLVAPAQEPRRMCERAARQRSTTAWVGGVKGAFKQPLHWGWSVRGALTVQLSWSGWGQPPKAHPKPDQVSRSTHHNHMPPKPEGGQQQGRPTPAAKTGQPKAVQPGRAGASSGRRDGSPAPSAPAHQLTLHLRRLLPCPTWRPRRPGSAATARLQLLKRWTWKPGTPLPPPSW